MGLALACYLHLAPPHSIRNLKKDSCSATSLLYTAFQGLWRVTVMLLFIKITMLLEDMESKAYCE